MPHTIEWAVFVCNVCLYRYLPGWYLIFKLKSNFDYGLNFNNKFGKLELKFSNQKKKSILNQSEIDQLWIWNQIRENQIAMELDSWNKNMVKQMIITLTLEQE